MQRATIHPDENGMGVYSLATDYPMTATPRKRRPVSNPIAEAFSTPRPYMPKDDRKQMLLEQAAALVEQGDWSELKMSALATKAGISRQLVYQHFPNQEALLIETATYLFNELWVQLLSIANNPELSLLEVNRLSGLLILDLRDGLGDAMVQLFMGASRHSPELLRFSKDMRDLTLDIWTPRVMRDMNLKKPAARAQIWMMSGAFWGIRQLMRDGVISRKQALIQFERLIASLTVAPPSV